MRAKFLRVLMLLVMLVVLTPAGSEETQAADAAAAAASKVDEADEAVETDKADRADEVKDQEEFKVPPDFRVKKRGKFTLYCRSESVMGTRFPSEKCYDETGIRELVRAQRETKGKLDQMRAICGQTGSCGGT